METVIAAVQYGDFVGEAKADDADRGGISSLAAKFGIRGTPVAVSIYSGEGGFLQVALYTPEKDGGGEDINAQAKANGGKLRVTKHTLQGATVADLLAVFKRFSVALRYRYPSVVEMEWEASEEAERL
jgi:hypothetical protein